MSAEAPTAVNNRLIASLPLIDQQRLLARCEPFNLAFAEVVTEAGKQMEHAIFPTRSFVSLVAPVDGRANLEVGLVGNEGMLGATAILGLNASPLHAVVQGAGPALRMTLANFLHELELSPALRKLVKCYLYVMIGQLAQTAACTHFHVVEERLARWLLMTQDRANSSDFHVTHEFLAYMLGVRRVGVTRAATSLQNRQLISYRRGNIRILDRDALEAASCSCYAEDRATYNRVMG